MTSLALPRSYAARRTARTALAAVGAIGAAVIVVCGLRIVVAATADPAFLVPSGRRIGYPAWMQGPLRGHGAPITIHTFLWLTAALLVAWLVVVATSRWLPLWFLAATVAITTVLFAVAPPLLSTDVFNYIAYGVMGTHGIDPYSHGAVVLSGRPLYGYTGHLWKHTPSAYGPLFTLISYALAPLGTVAAFWALKAIAGASVLAIAGFTWATARALGRDPRLPVAIVALNPLVLVWALGGAHNDLLMAVPLAAAVYFACTRRPASAGAAAVLAIAIKASAGLALPFVLLGARPRRRALAGAAVALAVVVPVTLVVFGNAIAEMPHALTAQQHFHWIVVSVPSFVGHYLHIGTPGPTGRKWFLLGSAAAVVAAIVWARKGRGWIDGAAVAMLAVLLTAAWVLPWYVVWALPFAALVPRPTIRVTAIVLTVLLTAMQLDHFLLTHASHHRHHLGRTHAALTRRS